MFHYFLFSSGDFSAPSSAWRPRSAGSALPATWTWRPGPPPGACSRRSSRSSGTCKCQRRGCPTESTRSISSGNRFSCSDNPGYFSDFSIDSTRTAHGLSLLCRPSASSSPLGVGKTFGRNAFELRSSVASIASWRAAEFSELLQHLEQLHRSQ